MSRSDSKFSDILKRCKKYDDSHVYKSCCNSDCPDSTYKRTYLVVMKKLEDTQTNESRHGVIDDKFAYFQANKLLVVAIIDENNPNDFNDLKAIRSNVILHSRFGGDRSLRSRRGFHDYAGIYEVNKLVEGHRQDVEKIHEWGINYFKTPLPALYYGIETSVYTGKYMSWYDNGREEKKCEYVNGCLSGECTLWYENGNVRRKCNYVYLSEGSHGNHKNHGNKKRKIYDDEILTGKFTEYHDNGTLALTCTYVVGKLSGEYIKWANIEGQKLEQYNYVDGKKVGDRIIWRNEGSTIPEYHKYVCRDGE